VRLTGKFDGVRVDVTFVEDEDAVGTLSSGGVKIRFIHVAGDTYVKPSDEYWKSSADPQAVIDFVDGRWIRVDPDDERFRDLAGLGDRGMIRDPLIATRDYTSGRPRTVRGIECIVVKPSFGGTLYLARSPSRLVRFDDGAGFVGDLDYDAPIVSPKAPSAVVEGGEVFAPDSGT
jgi:hypothetical protein